MEHVTDKQLLEWLEQSSAPPADWAQHLDQCESCQQRWQDLHVSWEALDAWTIETPENDLTDRILGQISPVPIVSLWQTQAWIRIAASVLIGAGAGILMGRAGTAPVSTEQAAQAIYLDTLALNSSTGWTTPLLDESQEP